MSSSTTFAVKINGGSEQSFTCRSGYYMEAAVAAIAMLEFERAEEGAEFVEIWVPAIDAEQRYRYQVGENEYGQLVVKNVHLVSEDQYRALMKHDTSSRFTRLDGDPRR
ncbi:hypothetical protein JZX87_12845 [Agrobacterium sp. Ap1]|uniref:hypothetical protein n=1 Tax=Agrobacterium sp. Ap1 TaxID=2815337 RepID=UPI001A8CFACC|nr:hypothetical protein [Agrobacterium sp. Ap1]MBO0142050.1 hypothetical protein [Agrobacterium sp. Ap1]